MAKRASTTAYISIDHQSFSKQCLEGKISAGDFEWKFIWAFGQGELFVEPPLGRALIKDALEKFLVRTDYNLEPGGDYSFTIRAKF